MSNSVVEQQLELLDWCRAEQLKLLDLCRAEQLELLDWCRAEQLELLGFELLHGYSINFLTSPRAVWYE